MKKLLLLAVIVGWGCGGETTGPTPTPDQGTDLDMAQDVSEDMVVVEPDMVVQPDMPDLDMTEDMPTDMEPTIRTLADYRTCEFDSDCPVGLGTCVLEIPLNQPDADGRDRVPLSEIFTSLNAGQGVCASVCTVNTEACSALSVNGNTPDPQPYVCQVVYVGTSPYPDPAPALPFDSELNAADLVAGVPFGAICRPPFQLSPSVDDGFCATCLGGEACPGTSLCWDALTNAQATEGVAGTCLGACDMSCPSGFECTAIAGGNYCKPIADTCTICQDRDRDGRGAGRCGSTNQPVTPVDCDDFNVNAYHDLANPGHAFPTYCAPENDFNCNGISDAVEQIASPNWGDDHCTACGDTCGGAVPNGTLKCINGVCQPACVGSYANCDGDNATGCETNVTDPDFIFYRDADGDGFGDPNLPQFGCDSVNPPAGHVADNTDCDDTRAEAYPGAPELCDGTDTNCDLGVDNGLAWIGEACQAAAQGVCQNGTRQCGGVMGEFCQPGTPSSETCNGLDDNCDGAVDRTGAQWASDAVLWYADCDRDGFGAGVGQLSCFAPTTAPPTCANGLWVTNNTDCDDTRALVYPGRTENCATSYDDNCVANDPESNWINATDYFRDADGDGYSPSPTVRVKGCGAPPAVGYSPALSSRLAVDCNDNNALVNPGQTENCTTPYDDNCRDGLHDATVGTVRRYTDIDGDGYGANTSGQDFCLASMTPAEQTTYSTMSGGDCLDSTATFTVVSNGTSYTGADRTPNKPEKCDGYDNNCDNVDDDGCPEDFTLVNQRILGDPRGGGSNIQDYVCPANKVMSGIRVHGKIHAGLCGGAAGVFGVRAICTNPAISEEDNNDPFTYSTSNTSSQTGTLLGVVPVPDGGCFDNTITDTTSNCGTDSSMRGLFGRSGSLIDRVGPVCVQRGLSYSINPSQLLLSVEADGTAEPSQWNGGGDFRIKCATNEVMKGIRARFTGSRLSGLDAICIDMNLLNK